MNRKAKRLGLPDVSYRYLSQGTEEKTRHITLINEGEVFTRTELPVPVDVYHYEFNVTEIKVEGYYLAGSVIHGYKINFVNDFTKDGSVDREFYEMADTGYCCHCHTRRNRKNLFIVRNDEKNEEIMVGSSCLKELVQGNSIEGIQFFNDVFVTIRELSEKNYEDGRPSGEFFFDPKVAVELALREYKAGNWEDNVLEWGNVVVDGTHRIIGSLIRRRSLDTFSIEISKETDELVEKILKIEDTSDFAKEIKYCLNREFVPSYKASVVAYAPKFLDNYLAKIEREKTAKESEFVGKIGERKTFKLKVFSHYSFDSNFGTCNINTFTDEDNNFVVWMTNSWAFYDKGDEVEIVGTIKKHETYRDTKQTHLTRCRVLN